MIRITDVFIDCVSKSIHPSKNTWFQTKVAELEEGMEANLGSQSAVLRTSMEEEFNEKMKVFYILSEPEVGANFLYCISWDSFSSAVSSITLDYAESKSTLYSSP